MVLAFNVQDDDGTAILLPILVHLRNLPSLQTVLINFTICISIESGGELPSYKKFTLQSSYFDSHFNEHELVPMIQEIGEFTGRGLTCFNANTMVEMGHNDDEEAERLLEELLHSSQTIRKLDLQTFDFLVEPGVWNYVWNCPHLTALTLSSHSFGRPNPRGHIPFMEKPEQIVPVQLEVLDLACSSYQIEKEVLAEWSGNGIEELSLKDDSGDITGQRPTYYVNNPTQLIEAPTSALRIIELRNVGSIENIWEPSSALFPNLEALNFTSVTPSIYRFFSNISAPKLMYMEILTDEYEDVPTTSDQLKFLTHVLSISHTRLLRFTIHQAVTKAKNSSALKKVEGLKDGKAFPSLVFLCVTQESPIRAVFRLQVSSKAMIASG